MATSVPTRVPVRGATKRYMEKCLREVPLFPSWLHCCSCGNPGYDTSPGSLREMFSRAAGSRAASAIAGCYSPAARRSRHGGGDIGGQHLEAAPHDIHVIRQQLQPRPPAVSTAGDRRLRLLLQRRRQLQRSCLAAAVGASARTSATSCCQRRKAPQDQQLQPDDCRCQAEQHPLAH